MRLRYNGLTTTLGAALSNVATSVTLGASLVHAGGAVPTVVAPDVLPLGILGASGLVEIVHVTAYTAGATTATILRGQEGTTGVAHASGAKAVNGITSKDVIDIEGRVGVLEAAPDAYKGLWVAGAYLAGDIVKTTTGDLFVASVATSAAPSLPGSDYTDPFLSIPSSPWDYSGIVAPASYTVGVSSAVRAGVTPPANNRCLYIYGGGNNQEPFFTLTLNFPAGGSISFKDAQDGEGADYGRFLIDGVQQHQTSSSWTARTYSVTPGTHVFKWLHRHDGSITQGTNSYGVGELATVGSVYGGGDWAVFVDTSTPAAARAALGSRVSVVEGAIRPAFSGAWVAGTYPAGSLVAYGDGLMTPRVATSVEPVVAAPNAGGVSAGGWTANSCASNTGGVATLIDNATSDNASLVSAGTALSWPTDLILEASVEAFGPTNAADQFHMGLLIGSAADTTIGGSGLKTSGFYGIAFDIYSGHLKWIANGSEVGTSVALAKAVLQTDGTLPQTRSLRLVRDETNLRLVYGAYSQLVIGPAVGVTTCRIAFGAYTGGYAGTFRVHGTPQLKVPSANWRRLANLVDLT